MVAKTSLELHLCADKLAKLQLHDGKNCCHNTKNPAPTCEFVVLECVAE